MFEDREVRDEGLPLEGDRGRALLRRVQVLDALLLEDGGDAGVHGEVRDLHSPVHLAAPM